jgi:predicted metal-dependent phosphoesterase TrpH
MKRIAPFTIIVGDEVMTSEGEIIGLFLTEEVPPFLSPEETVARIKAQGGLVCIPHPCDRLRPPYLLQHDALERIITDVDLIEVFNARTILSRDSARALRLAQSHNLPGTAGSDAHIVREVGRCYIELPEFNDAQEFILAVSQGQIFRHRTFPLIHFFNVRNRMVKRLQRG